MIGILVSWRGCTIFCIVGLDLLLRDATEGIIHGSFCNECITCANSCVAKTRRSPHVNSRKSDFTLSIKGVAKNCSIERKGAIFIDEIMRHHSIHVAKGEPPVSQ